MEYSDNDDDDDDAMTIPSESLEENETSDDVDDEDEDVTRASLDRAVRQFRRGDDRGGLTLAMADTPLSVLEEQGMRIDPMWKIPIWKGMLLADQEARCEGMVPCPTIEEEEEEDDNNKTTSRRHAAAYYYSRRLSGMRRHVHFGADTRIPKRRSRRYDFYRQQQDDEKIVQEDEPLTQGKDPELDQYICDEDDIVERSVHFKLRGEVINVFAPGPCVPETDNEESDSP
jgi:hypothetical protein